MNERKVALITGASRGIGRAIAVMATEFEYDFFLTGRDLAGLEQTADMLRAAAAERTEEGKFGCGRGPLIAIQTEDLSQPDAADSLFSAFTASFDRLDLLVNNAGIAPSGTIGGYTAEDWDRTMNVNARTPFFLMQHAIPYLKKAEPGFIINMGSVVAHKGYESQALYSASKHALLGFTKAIARDVRDTDIRIHAISPGGVDTDMVRGVRPDIDTSEMISPEEIADTVRFFLQVKGNAMVDEIAIRRKTKLPWD